MVVVIQRCLKRGRACTVGTDQGSHVSNPLTYRPTQEMPVLSKLWLSAAVHGRTLRSPS